MRLLRPHLLSADTALRCPAGAVTCWPSTTIGLCWTASSRSASDALQIVRADYCGPARQCRRRRRI